MKPIDEAGGDPACWAHIFEPDLDGELTVAAADLPAIARGASRRGPAWTTQCDDLNVNLMVFTAGEGVPDHVNTECDVLIVGIGGEGVIRINGQALALATGGAIVIPKGAVRSTRTLGERFAYLTCHRRRGGLVPTPRSPGQ